jgi:hypothetical protein
LGKRFGAAPGPGNGRINGSVRKGGPQTGARRQDPNYKPNLDDQYARLYAPDGKTPNTRVQGKRGQKGKETVSYFRGAPDQATAATPYYEVYENYAPAAESAMNREDIPTAYKKQVKDYFDSIQPSSSASGGKGGK